MNRKILPASTTRGGFMTEEEENTECLMQLVAYNCGLAAGVDKWLTDNASVIEERFGKGTVEALRRIK